MNETKTLSLDLKGEVCPYTFVKSKLMLEEMNLGEVLEAIVDRCFRVDCAHFTPNPDRFDYVVETFWVLHRAAFLHPRSWLTTLFEQFRKKGGRSSYMASQTVHSSTPQ